jgi:hypothetical protein
MPGLVVYAGADGDFAVWDPARNYWRETASGQVVPSEQPRAYQFARQSIERGLYEDGRVLCNGIVDDWKSWYYQQASQTPPLFALLARVIDRLSHPGESMRAGKPRRVFVDDAREFPTLDMPYGSVPYPHFSAGVARVMRLAYLLVWAWYEHTQAAALRGEEPTDCFILLIDEVEAHLHPKWQRVILPALIQVVEGLSGSLRVQAITATHSPMVLASLKNDPTATAPAQRVDITDQLDPTSTGPPSSSRPSAAAAPTSPSRPAWTTTTRPSTSPRTARRSRSSSP